MTTPDTPKIKHERLLFRYSMALERGDFETVEAILETAAHDPSLNRMIQELDAAYSTEPDSNPQTSGEYAMTHFTRPPILPQKRKQAPQSRLSSLFFPFAAVIAMALVGLALLVFNQPTTSEGTNQAPIVATTTPTLVPYIQPTNGVIVPIYCEGITRGEPETLLFTRPFVNEAQGTIIGRYEPNTLVPLNDIEMDSGGNTWYYVGDSNSDVEQGNQGWLNSINIELMEGCVNVLNEIIPSATPTPTSTLTETPSPTFTLTLTETPSPTFTATPSPTLTVTSSPTLTETPSSTPTALR